MDNKKIGKLIAKLRKEKELTQQQLGDMVGVGFRAVSKWERGLTLPDISLINDLSKILGISSDELLTGEIKKERTEKNKKNFPTSIKIIGIVLGLIVAIIILFILMNNKTYTYDLISVDDEYYLEGTASIKGNNISVVVNKLEFLDNQLNSTVITNYEYSMKSKDIYIFKYGYSYYPSVVPSEITIQQALTEFNVNYSGKTEMSRVDILKNNVILTLNFIDQNNNEMEKEIKISLVKKNNKNI